MKIALYGMPCAGKTFIMEKMSNVKVVHGSQELNRISGGFFSELSEDEKRDVRVKYTEYIKSLKDEIIISDGHYSFMEKIAFTEADGELYDVFVYIYCKPETLLGRYKTSEKNKKFANNSVAVIEQWQLFEMGSLREECHSRNKDFYVVSDNETDNCGFADFLEFVKNGFSSYKLAETICQEIRKIYPVPGKLYIVDGDKTIIKQDSFRFCCNGTTFVFDGNFYTGYQSFLFKGELKGYEIPDNKISAIEINEAIWKEIKDFNYVILSSGISDLWAKIGEQKGLLNIFADPLISADTKYFVVKLLKEQGYTITAYGDSKIDAFMLREADESILYIGERISRSLKGEDICGIHLIYDHAPYVLAKEKKAEILADIAICKSDSGINGSFLAGAHLRLGIQLGEKMATMIPEQNTALLVLERGGRFFGDGFYMGFGGTFYSINPSKEKLPNIKEDRIVIVDSVINSGKSIHKMISDMKAENPTMDIIIATNVIQKNTLLLFEEYKVFTVRVSENSFVGRNQAKQIGKTGPDTADRLFNLIERRF
ncbi:uracil phosphoribosyltransferase [Anaerobium acetethylicum]|uniref:Uracil phosphoribosyltransferase n=1 Tax=Anaerobium acetethylicum TaxID=1619234 RepID=A0A1D3TXR8_9FIRM|nr:uracil phosphoribosyltransferase [Anaerobium acetethylicum]SCP99151.1 Uracil phosphoribosyltransferase [Anaerobium acetethylicum]